MLGVAGVHAQNLAAPPNLPSEPSRNVAASEAGNWLPRGSRPEGRSERP